MMTRKKRRIAFFDFACCEGCQLTVLELLDDKLSAFLRHFEAVNWRETMSETSDEYEIAFCEGSITRQSDVDRIKLIRERAEILVALGTCASIGCHNELKNKWPMAEVLEIMYGAKAKYFDTIPARPIPDVVLVDYQILGCPVSMPELKTVLTKILMNVEYRLPNQPVCVECKLIDNVCVYEKGMVCMGPVTRCGCHAICTTYGDPCFGCRGLIDQANPQAMAEVLNGQNLHSIMKNVADKYQISASSIWRRLSIYNNPPPCQGEEYDE